MSDFDNFDGGQFDEPFEEPWQDSPQEGFVNEEGFVDWESDQGQQFLENTTQDNAISLVQEMAAEKYGIDATDEEIRGLALHLAEEGRLSVDGLHLALEREAHEQMRDLNERARHSSQGRVDLMTHLMREKGWNG